MRRVAVTGIGVVSPVGVGVEKLWGSLTTGVSGVRPITSFDVSDYPVRFAATIDDFDPSSSLDTKEARRMSRFQQFAVVAADEAMADAGLGRMEGEESERCGVIVGSGIGGLGLMEEQSAQLTERGPSRTSPMLVAGMIVDLAAGHISIRYNLRGINFAVVSACATGNHAIGEAFEIIRRGSADVIVAGGFDAGVTPLGLAGFCAARALSTRNDDPQGASRPFDLDRDGFVIGEGGGALILEEWDHAVARGARIHAEMLGYGATADAYHMTAPAPDGNGARRAMSLAIAQAGIRLEEVGYLNAHGTSTGLGDAAESGAIRAVFGDDAPPVSSTKSMTGHLLGGAAALEAIACIRALETGVLPPTINYTTPDPACDLDYVPNVARKTDPRIAVSNSFGFGGHNATIVLGRAEQVTAPLEDIEQRLGVDFADRDLLQCALTHPSWTEEHGGESYQRLEFLGDSVLGFVVADLMYARFPGKAEGELTRMKWALVCGSALASVGRSLHLDTHIRVGRGASRDAQRDSVLEACFEAVVGAVFLDRGLAAARDLVIRALGDRLDETALSSAAVSNPKGELQELVQAKGLGLPAYRITSMEGPGHELVFSAEVVIGERVLGGGTGTSKQAAEREAALAALAGLLPKAAERP